MPYDLNFTFNIASGSYSDELTLTLARQEIGVNAAPFGIWFECTSVSGCAAAGPAGGAVYDPQFHDIVYVWDFGDAANAVPATALNLPDAWKDVNRACGRRVAHVFNDPGTYTVTCHAYEPATRRFGSKTISVTIGDPATVFPASRTIIFNPAAIPLSGYGITGYTETSTWAATIAARNAIAAQTARILIAPGVILDLAAEGSAWHLAYQRTWKNIRIGALDPAGARPVIRTFWEKKHGVAPYYGTADCLIFDDRHDASECLLYGLDCRSYWNSTEQRGKATRPFGGTRSAGGTDFAFVLHRCAFDGFDVVAPHDPAAGETLYYICSDTSVTNWRDYGLHAPSHVQAAFIAVSAAHNVDALSGGPKNWVTNRHGPLRDFGADDLFISVCDFFTRTGWFPGTNNYADVQHALRINTNGNLGIRASIDRLAAEGAIAMAEQNNTGVAVNIVFDKVLVAIGARQPEYHGWNIRHGGVTVRNVLNVKLDVPSFQHGLASWFELQGSASSAEALAAPMQGYDCTSVDLRGEASASGAGSPLQWNDEDDDFADVTFENNILHEPNRAPAVIPDGPVDTATVLAGWAARDKGPRFGFRAVEGTLATAVAPGNAMPEIPYSAIGQSTVPYGTDGSAATDRTYWEANLGPGTTIMTNYHYSAEFGELSVTLSDTGVTITNTSPYSWAAGSFALRLDRPAAVPGFDPQYDCTGMTVPLARPQTGTPDSAAIDDGDVGPSAYDDLLGAERPASGNERGAFLQG